MTPLNLDVWPMRGRGGAMTQTSTTYEKVSFQAYKTVKCPQCGKKLRRQRTFYQTLNPFNQNEEGKAKSRDEIHRELVEEAEAWKDAPAYCTKYQPKSKSK